MDIKEIALKVAEESGAVGYSPAPLRAVRGYSFTYEQLQNFAEALIESYKAELLKEVGEPVAYFSDEFFSINTKQNATFNAPLYTSDQLAAAVLKAIKQMEKEVERLKTVPMKYRRMAFNAQLQDENKELRAQLAAAQEEMNGWRNQAHQSQSALDRLEALSAIKDGIG